MDPVERKIDNAEQAHKRLQEALVRPADDMVRDSAILRFTLSAETVWKAARALIADRWGAERIHAAGPKAMVRESVIAGLLTEAQGEAAIKMMKDRDLTVHTYDQEAADKLFSRLPAHADLIDIWLKAMRASLQGR